MREECVILEYKPDPAFLRRKTRNVAAVNFNRADAGFLESRDHSQSCRFAATRGPEHRKELSLGNVEIDVVDGKRFSEKLAEAGKSNAAHEFCP